MTESPVKKIDFGADSLNSSPSFFFQRSVFHLFAASKIPHLRHDKDSTFYFDTSDVSLQEEVIGAEFRLYKDRMKRSRDSDCLIEVFRIAQGLDPEYVFSSRKNG